MNDEYVDKGKVITCVAWAVVIGFMALAWVVILATPHWQVGGMFAAMACASSAMAATMQIRCYAVRVMCLVRTASGLIGSDFDRPRPLRDR